MGIPLENTLQKRLVYEMITTLFLVKEAKND